MDSQWWYNVYLKAAALDWWYEMGIQASWKEIIEDMCQYDEKFGWDVK